MPYGFTSLVRSVYAQTAAGCYVLCCALPCAAMPTCRGVWQPPGDDCLQNCRYPCGGCSLEHCTPMPSFHADLHTQARIAGENRFVLNETFVWVSQGAEHACLVFYAGVFPVEPGLWRPGLPWSLPAASYLCLGHRVSDPGPCAVRQSVLRCGRPHLKPWTCEHCRLGGHGSWRSCTSSAGMYLPQQCQKWYHARMCTSPVTRTQRAVFRTTVFVVYHVDKHQVCFEKEHEMAHFRF